MEMTQLQVTKILRNDLRQEDVEDMYQGRRLVGSVVCCLGFGWLVFVIVLVVLLQLFFNHCLLLFSVIYPSMLFIPSQLFSYCILVFLLSCRLLHCLLVTCNFFFIAFFFFVPGFAAFEPMVFLKQLLYLYEVVIMSSYILPSPVFTCGISLDMLLQLYYQMGLSRTELVLWDEA